MRKISSKIKDLRSILGMDQTAFGKLIGDVDQSTVSRWERNVQKPGAGHIIRMAELAGVSPQQFLGIAAPGGSAADRRVRVIGSLQAGDWREALEWPTEEQYEVPAPLPQDLQDRELIGFEIHGPSMNQVYPDGSVVYVEPLFSLGREPKSGERVAVQRVSADGTYEATCKEYVVGPDGHAWLWPRSNDPQHQTPIPFVDGRRRTREVLIIGVVRAALIVENPNT